MQYNCYFRPLQLHCNTLLTIPVLNYLLHSNGLSLRGKVSSRSRIYYGWGDHDIFIDDRNAAPGDDMSDERYAILRTMQYAVWYCCAYSRQWCRVACAMRPRRVVLCIAHHGWLSLLPRRGRGGCGRTRARKQIILTMISYSWCNSGIAPHKTTIILIAYCNTFWILVAIIAILYYISWNILALWLRQRAARFRPLLLVAVGRLRVGHFFAFLSRY